MDEAIQKIVDDLWFAKFGNESKKHVPKEEDKKGGLETKEGRDAPLVLSKDETEEFIKQIHEDMGEEYKKADFDA